MALSTITFTIPSSCAWSVSGLPSWVTVLREQFRYRSSFSNIQHCTQHRSRPLSHLQYRWGFVYRQPGGSHGDVQLFAQPELGKLSGGRWDARHHAYDTAQLRLVSFRFCRRGLRFRETVPVPVQLQSLSTLQPTPELPAQLPSASVELRIPSTRQLPRRRAVIRSTPIRETFRRPVGRSISRLRYRPVALGQFPACRPGLRLRETVPVPVQLQSLSTLQPTTGAAPLSYLQHQWSYVYRQPGSSHGDVQLFAQPELGKTFRRSVGTLDITLTIPSNCTWSVSSLPPWITISGNGNGTGPASITFNIAPNTGAARSATFSISGALYTVNQSMFGQSAPVISQNGIVPLSGSVPVIQAGSWISIYGTSLAGGTESWNGDFPTSLAGVSVTINGKPAYLSYVSPTQINVQAPGRYSDGNRQRGCYHSRSIYRVHCHVVKVWSSIQSL